MLAYVAVVVWFGWICADFYIPGKGFTYLIMFGDRDAAQFVPELKAVNHYQIPDSVGYDATHYAQIAMHPQLGDPVLRDAVDSLPYRARRILFCWTAYGLALGDPARALHIYAVQNIACWLLLAALMLRWFPPVSWGNFARWAGVLLSFGLCFSVRGALVDGPSLLLIAAGVALAEAGRPWWSAALLGISGLGKETNVLGAAALAPAEMKRGAWRAFARAALVAVPLAVWLVTLQLWLGDAMDSGYRNFAAPFVAYVGKWREIIAGWQGSGDAWAERGSALIVVALTTQFLFFALRPRWRETWWRVGAAYAVLMAVIGEAVWEGYPGAASRVLLPMALAFNILVPRGAAWWPVLLLGNLTFLVTPETLQPPVKESYELAGPRALRANRQNGEPISVKFDQNWHGGERTRWHFWQWSRGSASLTVHNPHPFPVLADIRFIAQTQSERGLVIRDGERERWRDTLRPREPRRIEFPSVRLEPGENVWRFETDRPAVRPENNDPRELAINVRNLTIEILRPANRDP